VRVLLAILLSTAMQVGSGHGTEPLGTPAAQGRAPETEAPAEKTGSKEKSDDDPGLRAEIDRLAALQREIRALLETTTSQAPEEAAAGYVKEATGEESARPSTPSEPPTTLNAVAAADALYLLGDYHGALALYDRAAADNPNDACWLIFQKANCLRWLGRSAEAVNAYQRIVTEHPDNFLAAEAEWWIGAVQWRIGLSEN